MKVLGISGSLRRESHNSQLLRAAASALPPGAELEVWDALAAVPPFNQDDEAKPPQAVQSLRSAVINADALLISTPEYNRSIPGALKNALDWLSRPDPESGVVALRNKPTAVIGASTGSFGAVWGQAELRKVMGASGARVVDQALPVVHAHEAFNNEGHLVDPDRSAQLDEILNHLAHLHRQQTAGQFQLSVS